MTNVSVRFACQTNCFGLKMNFHPSGCFVISESVRFIFVNVCSRMKKNQPKYFSEIYVDF